MLWNALLLALRAIRRNVLRSFLTVLGIVIGVGSVIIMVNLGNAATASVTAQIASLGSNMLIVRPGQRRGPGSNEEGAALTLADAEAIRREVPGLAAVAPTANKSMTAVFGNSNWSTTVTGTDNAYRTVRDWALVSGRDFTPGELAGGRAVCIIGDTVRRELIGPGDPIGVRIRLKNIACEVIGLLEPKGQSSMGQDQDDAVLVPLRMFWRRVAGNQDVGAIQLSARDGVATTKVQAQTERLMRERRRIKDGADDDFHVFDMRQITNTLTNTTRSLTGLLGAVAAVSLLVGGIGIMNIMLVSVTERTREIGIRLAIGALGHEVLLQFLVEAVVLAALGGVAGIALALGVSWLASDLMGMPFLVDWGIVLIAFLFSAAVGVVFGYFPARRAARLEPIEALRHE